MNANLVAGDAALAHRLMLDQWIYQPACPMWRGPIPRPLPRWTRRSRTSGDTRRHHATAGKAACDRPRALAGWTSAERQRFLARLAQGADAAAAARARRASRSSPTGNNEVLFLWLKLALANRYEPAVPLAEQFLASVGRRKFVRPLFETLMGEGAWGQPIARRIYAADAGRLSFGVPGDVGSIATVQPRGATARSGKAIPLAQSAHRSDTRMLRQYELVERVMAYDPDADEAMLNRAYVYTVQKHGTQKRAAGDPYFSHPIEVAGLMTELKLDQETIVTALLHDTVEDTLATHRRGRAVFRARHRAAGRRRHQALQDRGDDRERARGREPAQVLPGDERGHPRPARQAGRPAAQHAHAAFHQERGKAPAHRQRDDGYLCPARRAGGHVRIYARDAAARLRAA